MSQTTVNVLAKLVGGTVCGNGEILISGISSLDYATQSQISFLSKINDRYIELAKKSIAGCILTKNKDLFPNRTIILVEDPSIAFVKIISFFSPDLNIDYVVSKKAIIDTSVELGKKILVEDGAIISPGCIIGSETQILAGAVIKESCTIGEKCIIHPGVVMYPDTRLGNRVVVHSNTVIGSDGFGYNLKETEPLKIPHIGKVVLEDDVEIGACSCIERATLDETRIGARTKIGDLVNIGHNVKIGSDTVIINQTGISGSVIIGKGCRIWAQVVIRGNLTIGDYSKILACSFVTRSVSTGEVVMGNPAMPHIQWKRILACLPRLPKLFKAKKI